MSQIGWFGTGWDTPAIREMQHVPTPEGEECMHCEEPIVVDIARGGASHRPIHRECDLRTVVGSVGHLIHKCSCYGGLMGDPPLMSRRQAAHAACVLFEIGHGYEIAADGLSITCFTCGRRSFNANDVRARYCSECHEFHEVRDTERMAGLYR